MATQVLTGFFYRPNQKTRVGDEIPADPWQAGQMTVTDEGYFGTFAAVPSSELPATGTRWFLPGLCDVHAHLQVELNGNWADSAAMLESARAHTRQGVLAIRDCGGRDKYPEAVRNHPDMPPIIYCGRHVAREKRYLRDLPENVEPALLPQALYEQAKRSDGWVKIVGDWIDRSGGVEADLLPLWPKSALKEAIAAAHEGGAKVTVHHFGRRGIDDLLEAGIDGIEHGNGINPEQASEIAARKIPVTPTLLQTQLFTEFAAQAGTKYPVYAQTMNSLYQERKEHFQMLVAAGVQLVPGTDAGSYQRPGEISRELELWLEWAPQLSLSRLIELSTYQCRQIFGWDCLDSGARADFLEYDCCPTESYQVFRQPVAIYLSGRRVR